MEVDVANGRGFGAVDDRPQQPWLLGRVGGDLRQPPSHEIRRTGEEAVGVGESEVGQRLPLGVRLQPGTIEEHQVETAGADRRRQVELGVELLGARADVVADRTHLVEREPLRIAQVPVDIALAGDVRARVAAAHRDHDVGPLRIGPIEQVRDAAGEIDADLTHHLHDLGMHALAGIAPRRARLVAAAGHELEQRRRHLRAARVVDADEEDATHAGSCSVGAASLPRTSW